MPNTNKKIGVCCTTMHKEPMLPIIDSLAKLMKLKDYRMVVFQCFEDLFYNDKNDAGARSVFSLINPKMFELMILFPNQVHDKEVFRKVNELCAANGIPVITVDETFGMSYHIKFGYGEAFGSIVEHVITKHGCKKIKFLAGVRDNEFSQTRIDSCRDIMAAHGLELPDSDIMYGYFWEGPTYEEMDRFFASGEPLPDAFICSNDAMAMAVCLKLHEKGYSIPGDVIVTGFDGIEMERYHTPRLCTAIRDNDELAGAILKLSEQIMAGDAMADRERVLSYRPVFSESCGCKKMEFNSNKKLTDYMQNYSSHRQFEEHIDKMENRIAANSSIDNVQRILRKYGFGGSVILITDDFYSNFLDSEKKDGSAKAPYPQDMHIFTSTTEGANAEYTKFSSNELLPDLDKSFGEYNILFVLPIHFQEMIIGYMVTPYSPSEHHSDRLYSFTTSLNRSLEQMRVREHMELLNRKLSFMFTHDFLTGLFNRYGFYESFRDAIEQNQDAKDVFVVSADLNDMKYINDNFGHSAGDDALLITAKALRGAAEGDKSIICSRFGGDEFVVAKVCVGDADEQGARYQEQFERTLRELNSSSGKPFKVHISLGVYSAKLDNVSDIDSLIELADKLMYSDKARYKRKPRSLPPELSEETKSEV